MTARKVTARTRLVFKGKTHPVGAELEVPEAVAERWARLGAVDTKKVRRTKSKPVEAEAAPTPAPADGTPTK